MPVSARKLAANRRNALKSTGPLSAASKEPAKTRPITTPLSPRFSRTHTAKKNARLKAEIGFESQKRAEAAEARKEAEATRKQEQHTHTVAAANARRQREEIKTAKALADILPPVQSERAHNQLNLHSEPGAKATGEPILSTNRETE